MRIDMWSDVVCVWCYIAERRLEKALARFEHAADVNVVWRSFQLDPSYPRDAPRPASVVVAEKTGASVEQLRATADKIKDLAGAEGLGYDFDRSVMANTFDAHRLTHLARAYELDSGMHRRLMRAHFVDGESLDDTGTLIRLAAEVGVPADHARRVLAGDNYATDVDEDIRQAQMLGVTSVPHLVLDRTFSISGAQSVEVFLSALVAAHQHVGAPMPS